MARKNDIIVTLSGQEAGAGYHMALCLRHLAVEPIAGLGGKVLGVD
jgi:hypothetical protein